MFTYNNEEIIEDIFAFEGTQIKMSQEVKTYKLYSDWAEHPLPGSATVADLTKRLKKYLEECAIPNLEVPISHAFTYQLYAGNQEPLSLIIQTNEESVIKKEVERVLSKESTYTICFLVAGDEVPKMYVRGNH